MSYVSTIHHRSPSQLSYPNLPGGYGGYGTADPEIQQWFNAVDVDRSGKITAKELQSALVNGQGKNFNLPVCELLISMFSKDQSGTVNVDEFQHLYKFVNQWLQTFKSFDKDQSGVIEEEEVSQAFQQMGYRFSNEFIKFLIGRADKVAKKRISVDQFILVCIQIQRFTDAFRVRDTEMKGVITVSFEDFLTVALSCSS
ncbi:Peflin, putative [Pediculus humanus corporis]|uniref:Peflin, putative n=1 Tax=Pediculus humanus subsp. corporis TaxID=121224 RepID=E0VUU8_PEDHC|nr:Peflin, putative [Pediculus humanus corporis]EEB17154.1 Peflin, putative [Pediculus humanus corporis]